MRISEGITREVASVLLGDLADEHARAIVLDIVRKVRSSARAFEELAERRGSETARGEFT